jgi:drug/metabolite transporter (DMT)-like permease
VDLHRRALGGWLIGLAAAVTFGAGTPFAKRLLEDTRPQLLAGLLYLGAFIVLAAVHPFRRRSREARLRAADAPRLVGLVACGGVLAPVLLLLGLDRVSGSAGSLLLNLEGPCTMVIGLAVFGEHLGRRAWFGAAVVFAGGALLSLSGPAGSVDALGALCIAAACLLWGVDNNLTQSLTLRDPFSIVGVKAGAAAAVNLSLAGALGATWPSFPVVLGALAVGAVAYGASIVLDAYALRSLGAAREAIVFASAPFVGALLSIPVLSETMSATEVFAGLAMAAGILLMIQERHVHEHEHEPLVHDHLHVHDEHHLHEHHHGVPADEPHAHEHRHATLRHRHRHVSDAHHRHRH